MTVKLGGSVSTAGPGFGPPSHTPRGPQVPIGPIQDWCQAQINAAIRCYGIHDGAYAPHANVAARLGINPRILRRIMRGLYAGSRNGHKGQFPTTTIGRSYVEDMLTRAGVDFYEIYPELEFERDIEIEPDGWCRCCREFVTPIFGLCPWDDTPVDVAKEWAA